MKFDDEKLDHWEWSLVHKYSIPSPHNDLDAYNEYPEHNWIYDKYKFSRKFNPLTNVSLSKFPDSIRRPRVSFWGMGRDVELNGEQRYGHFYQDVAVGCHYSVDIRGDRAYCYRGRYLPGKNKFFLWHRCSLGRVHRNISRVVTKFSGVRNFNFEIIGNTVIEAHLRPSIQFWSLPKYSLVVHDFQVDTPGKRLKWKPKTVHDAFVLKPNIFDSRVMIVNGDNLRDCYRYAMFCMSGDDDA